LVAPGGAAGTASKKSSVSCSSRCMGAKCSGSLLQKR
jgi:hypothetical protein